MNKQVTPMQSLKGNFTNFEEILKSNKIKYSIWENSSREAFNPSQYDEYKTAKKAIASDFIRVLEFGEDMSIGFIFDYENLQKEDQMMSVSCKFDGEQFSSKGYSVEEARLVFKKLNKNLKAINDLKTSDVLNQIIDGAIKPRLIDEVAIEESKKEVESFIKDKIDSNNKISEKYREKEKESMEANKRSQEEIENSPEYILVEKLRKELEKAQSNLIQKSMDIRLENNVFKLSNESNKLEQKKIESEQDLESTKNKAIKESLRKSRKQI